MTVGQVVAQMDLDVLQGQLRQAEAQARQVQSGIATARSKLAQRESEKAAAQATVMQRQAELDLARKRSARSSALALKAAVSQQGADDDQARTSLRSRHQCGPGASGGGLSGHCHGPLHRGHFHINAKS